MSNSLHIVCPSCGGVNRVPQDRLASAPHCGKCKDLLFQGKPVALGDNDFQRHLERSDIPLVVDFWAAWCGPCRMMAPAFEQAAQQMEPRVRFVKVDTEAARMTAGRFNIRSIPTLILFHQGQEVGRMSGAMDSGGLTRWIQGQLARIR